MAFIRSDSNAVSSGSLNISLGASYAQGTSIIVVASFRPGSDTTLSNYTVSFVVSGTTYTLNQDIITFATNNGGLGIFSLHNLSVAIPSGTSIAVDMSTSGKKSAVAMNFSDLTTTSTLDKTAFNPTHGSNSPSASTYASGATATTVRVNELLVGGVMLHTNNTDDFTASTGWTKITDRPGSTGNAAGSNATTLVQYKEVSSTNAYESDPSRTTHNYRSAIATYRIRTPPTISPNTADATAFGTDTTPTLEFTGSDADSDDLRYQVQISKGELGSEAINRSSSFANNYTLINDNNPAYVAGTVTQIEVYAFTSISNLKVGSFYGSGDTYTLRDSEVLGSAASGAKRTFTGLSLSVEVGDVLGLVYTAGSISIDTTGGNRYLYKASDQFANGTVSGYTASSGGVVSVIGRFDGTFTTLDKLSGTDSGFLNTVNGADTDPFTAGQKVSYTVQAGNALADGTYYWRARVLDPLADIIWSSWTTTRSFTINTGGGGTTGYVKVWNGSAWVAKPVKVWNGSSWVTKPVKRWNGSSWVTT